MQEVVIIKECSKSGVLKMSEVKLFQGDCLVEMDIITCVFMLLQTFALFMIAYK